MRFIYCCLALLSFSAPAQAQAPNPIIKLTANLEARIGLVSRGADRRSEFVLISMEVFNRGANPVQLLLVGPAPFASDNAGKTYAWQGVSGVAFCSQMMQNDVPKCIGQAEDYNRVSVPINAYTHVDPGTSISINFQVGYNSGFRQRNSEEAPQGNLLSFSSVFAYRIIGDALADETLSIQERRKQIKLMNVSFPVFPIQRAPEGYSGGGDTRYERRNR